MLKPGAISHFFPASVAGVVALCLLLGFLSGRPQVVGCGGAPVASVFPDDQEPESAAALYRTIAAGASVLSGSPEILGFPGPCRLSLRLPYAATRLALSPFQNPSFLNAAASFRILPNAP